MRVIGNKTTQHSFILMLILLGTVYNLNAEVYRWKDSKGVTHYSDRPPIAITENKSDAILLKIIKDEDLCAAPDTKKENLTTIDMGNSYFFSIIRNRVNQRQSPNASLANASSGVANAAPSAATATARSSPPRAVQSATNPIGVMQNRNNSFGPLAFNSVTRSTPFGVSVARLTPQATPTPVATSPATPISSPQPTATATTPATSSTTNNNLNTPITNPTSAVSESTPPVTPTLNNDNTNIAVANPVTSQNTASNWLASVDLSKTPPGNSGFNTLRIRAAQHDGVHKDQLGAFRTDCAITHYNNDDPIIFPGVRGAAHHHTFFGNTSANYASTPDSILNSGNSSCAGGIANRSGYWMPSIIDTATGAPLKPWRGIIYYKQGLVPGRFIQPFPKGLRMIAGEMNAKTIEQNTKQPPHDNGNEPAKFMCVNESSSNQLTNIGKVIPACNKSTTGRRHDGYIRVVISFPQCWDGKNLDSPDHKSHMAYAHWRQVDANGRNYFPENRCPTTHPIPVPEISEIFDFEITDAVHGTNNWRLSSDNYPTTQRGGLTLHADWMNGWDESIMNRIVKNCLNKSIDCGMNYLGDGETLY